MRIVDSTNEQRMNHVHKLGQSRPGNATVKSLHSNSLPHIESIILAETQRVLELAFWWSDVVGAVNKTPITKGRQ